MDDAGIVGRSRPRSAEAGNLRGGRGPAADTERSRSSWGRPLGRVCVLDLEAASDPHALVLSGRGRGASGATTLREIVAASVLTFEERERDRFEGFALRSFHHARHSETDILQNVLSELKRVEAGGLLVTFNGRSFDLPLIWARQLRWWLCADDVVTRLEADADRHLDVMLAVSLSAGRWPTLADACANLGFCLNGAAAIGDDATIPPQVRKCERDVAGTAMVFLHLLAARRRSIEPLRSGLPALGAFLKSIAGGRQHLERFALNRQLSEGARPWGAR